MADNLYLSPVRKLVRFFEQSRNRWKKRCLTAQARTKRLSNRVRQLEASRELWKERAQQCQEALQQLREELEASKNAFTA
jgi:chromosome segregation ATPase